jgi:hypothetical protein
VAEETVLSVERYDDPEALADPEGWGHLAVGFSDEAANDREDLVAQCVDVIAAFPGVQRAEHEDRELILVWGPDVDPEQLEATLLAWWAAHA